MFRTAVLVIHGFCGGLWENEYLVNKLQQHRNLDVFAYTLPGHEKDFLGKIDYNEWIVDTEEHLKELLSKYNRVILIGHSMGGVIASFLATKYRIKKLILISPAFDYFNFSQNIEDLKDIKSIVKEKNNYAMYKDFATKLIRYSPFVLNEFRKLVNEYKECVKNIECPTLIIHGTDDEIVKLKSSKEAFECIKSNKKYLKVFDGVKHRVFFSDKKDEIVLCIYNFIRGGLRWIQK